MFGVLGACVAFLAAAMPGEGILPREWKPKVKGFAEDIVPQYTNDDFQRVFRISKEKAEEERLHNLKTSPYIFRCIG